MSGADTIKAARDWAAAHGGTDQSGYYDRQGNPIPGRSLSTYGGQIVLDGANIPGRLTYTAGSGTQLVRGADGKLSRVPNNPSTGFNPLSPSEAYYYGFGPDPTPPVARAGPAPPQGPGPFGGSAEGGLVGTQVPGLFINPNTGGTIDARDPNHTVVYDSAPPGYSPVYSGGKIVDIKPLPATKTVNIVKGLDGLYNMIGDDGSITGTINDPSYHPSYGAPTDLGNGLFGVPDGKGGFSSFMTGAPSADKYSGIKAIGNGYVTKVDAAGNPIGSPFQDLSKPVLTGTKDLGNGFTGMVDDSGKVVSSSASPDYMSPAHLKYLNDSLDADTADKKATLLSLEKRAAAAEAGADRRSAAQIAGQIASTKAQIASNEHIASIQDHTTRAVAILNAGVTERGQSLGYLSTARGQNLNYNLGVAQQGDSLLQHAATFEGTGDTMRTAAYLLGDRGGTTPVEGALAAQDRLVKTMQPLEVNPSSVPIPAVQTIPAAKGIRALPRGQPGERKNILVGDTPSGTPDGHEELVRVRAIGDGRYEFLGVVPHDQIGDGTKVHARAADGYAGGKSFDVSGVGPGGSMPLDFAPPPVAPVRGRTNPNESWWMKNASGTTHPAATTQTEYAPISDAELKTIMGTLDKVDDATLYSKYALRRVNGQYFRSGTLSWERGPASPLHLQRAIAQATARQPAAAAPPATTPPATTPATTPAPLTRDDALLSTALGPGYTGNLDDMRATTAKVLHDAFHAPPTPMGGLDVGLGERPLFGETLLDPKQVAYDWTTRPQAVKNTMLSAWGLRNLDANEVQHRIAAVTPTALGSRPMIGWG